MVEATVLECSVDPNTVAFLDGPEEFYRKLCSGYSAAKVRAVLACLYVGCGELENELIRSIVKAKERTDDLTVDVLVDKARTSRVGRSGEIVSPLTMLKQYLDDRHKTTVALFHNPLLGRLCSKMIKSPYCEAFGTMHIKIYIADDECIITGANAGRDYFVDRYDRYMLVKDPLFADLMHTFVKTFQSASFRLTHKLTLEWQSDMVNPLEDNMLFRKQLYIRTEQMVRMCEEVLRKNRNRPYCSKNNAQDEVPAKFRAITPKAKANEVKRTHTVVNGINNGTHERGDGVEIALDESDSDGFLAKRHVRQNVSSYRLRSHAEELENLKHKRKGEQSVYDVDTTIEDKEEMTNGITCHTPSSMDPIEIGESDTEHYCFIKICLHLPFTEPPFMQGVNMLEEWLLGYARAGYSAVVATAYLNFTDRYVEMFKEILDIGKANGKHHPLQVVTSSPYANSFYRDGTLKRNIALFYSTAATWLFKALKDGNKYPEDIYMEYNRPNHTFHAKGIWVLKDRVPVSAAHKSEKEFDSCVDLPCATVIGSSNYGKRSYDRDMEITLLVETNSPEIRRFMRRELYNMIKHSEYVPFDVVGSRIGPHQHVIGHVMNSFL
ncbi:putative CDP-diacylglycerol--glycerol-3-phosphate 3-phosphatidyltransferase [Babesia sp. Xinjiang]|uniref:putative CDP-diacylglycerol--glycerol-3-phosphate 3-phosphatidyltransferase n=1 Tax=Babesia sp. Xinjiang TaxID=462227 RepID=UPI000A232770|nr:putative CDP-diacylglycerol--glycerol-3-phosphate 3-phosphatidyltransferase [Babesia sp. Xinjiang]ORM39346.1 putative CDP-diacylglycerol--glycerol-3-phosphate 3-phosphatidyltransferase [Babesia sp. Xinjiang]